MRSGLVNFKRRALLSLDFDFSNEEPGLRTSQHFNRAAGSHFHKNLPLTQIVQ